MIIVRLKPHLGFFLLLIIALPCSGALAQSAPKPTTVHLNRRASGKAAAEQPETPAPPPTLEQTPPTSPQITYRRGQLTINAPNSTLSQVLRAVQTTTGASVEMPGSAAAVRVATNIGPGQPRDVLNTLLNGSRYNYILLGVNGNPGAVQKVILTTERSPTAVNTAQNTGQMQPQDDTQSDEAPSGYPPEAEINQEPQPQAPTYRPQIPGRRMPEAAYQRMQQLREQQQEQQQDPQQEQPEQPEQQPQEMDNTTPQEEVKTPEQLLQEMQQIQQQQQQMEQQLNPANRQPQ